MPAVALIGTHHVQTPLVVDLDGTLIHTDMLHESALKVFRDQPFSIFQIPLWLLQGKAVLKEKLARRLNFDASTLPYNQPLLYWLQSQRAGGRPLILCTASDQKIADAIAEHLQLFDEVIASNGATNLSGPNKAKALIERFGAGGFDYAGNSWKDVPVWQQSRQAVLVNAPAALGAKARQVSSVEQEFPAPVPGLLHWIKLLRAHQWLKNLLIFVPLLAAHEIGNTALWPTMALAFMAFSLCASAVYITNDLFDLESDRLHQRKRLRPFASGVIPAWKGVLLVPPLLLAALLLALQVGNVFVYWLGAYFVLTCAYSFGLKRLMLIDCLTLAMLYTLRIIAGAAAAGLEATFWLLAESIFLFLSLAFVKRYAELHMSGQSGVQRAHGRGYYTSDAALIQTLGVTSGYIAVLVLAFYFNSEAIIGLYRTPVLVWTAIPFMLFWISWMWMQASRGNMHDDPLVFAVKDRASLLAGFGFAMALVLAATGVPF